MFEYDSYLLGDDYRQKYKELYGKEPKYVPTKFIKNKKVKGIELKSTISRLWISNIYSNSTTT